MKLPSGWRFNIPNGLECIGPFRRLFRAHYGVLRGQCISPTTRASANGMWGLYGALRDCAEVKPGKDRSTELCRFALNFAVFTAGVAGRDFWWSRWDSNPRPPRCHRGALPTAPRPHRVDSAMLTFVPSIRPCAHADAVFFSGKLFKSHS